jgi:voltage-gated potassium channel
MAEINVLRLFRRVSLPIIGLIILITFGMVSFSIVEDVSLFDGLYWTITVISTVGFGDITPKTMYGKLIFIMLVIFGLSMFGYFLTILSSIITERNVLRSIFAYFMLDGGRRLRNHVILLGWNNHIRYAYDEIVANGLRPVVVVETDDEARRLLARNINVVVGNISDPETFEKLNIHDAKAVVIAYNDHAKTILTTLKIRKLVKDTPIIASYTEKELEDVISQAGVSKLINVSEVGGRLLANQVFEPHATSAALDLLSRGGLDLSEAVIPENLDGVKISDLKDKGFTSKIIMVVRNGVNIPNPPDDFRLNGGDVVVLLGVSEEIDKDVKILGRG